jgi:hypothetical protein
LVEAAPGLGVAAFDFAGAREAAFLAAGSPLAGGLGAFGGLAFSLCFGTRKIDMVGSGSLLMLEALSELARKRSYPDGSEDLGILNSWSSKRNF